MKAKKRDRLLPGLTVGLIRRGKIQTTLKRAKLVQARIDRLITQAKKKTLASRRKILETLFDKKLAKRLVEEIAPKLGQRQSGFTRAIKIGSRKGDGAMMVKLEFVQAQEAAVVPEAVSTLVKEAKPKPRKTIRRRKLSKEK